MHTAYTYKHGLGFWRSYSVAFDSLLEFTFFQYKYKYNYPYYSQKPNITVTTTDTSHCYMLGIVILT